MLPSLIATMRAGQRPGASAVALELWLYIAYDAGDAFFDSAAREAEIHSWLQTHLEAPLAAAGLPTRHALLRYVNAERKPGPVFNYMMAAAYEDGADYLYRVNDDTQFVTPGWAAQAIRTLRGFSPPNVGVVGPICPEGNTRILTHDLVHRTHLDIFGIYYPRILSDWWMDDWITFVYDTRMRKGPWRVHHRVDMHGTRYVVDQSHERRLAGELSAGRTRIQRWIQRHGSTSARPGGR